jgi:hypothetical protein
MRVLTLLTLIALLLAGCSGSAPSALKPVQQQNVGEYTVSILSESGGLKEGASQYTIEFRRTSNGQLADVGTVEVAPIMEMAGMGPMMGEANVTSSETPGRYEVESNLSMAGLWKITVKFGNDQQARFSLSAQ